MSFGHHADEQANFAWVEPNEYERDPRYASGRLDLFIAGINCEPDDDDEEFDMEPPEWWVAAQFEPSTILSFPDPLPAAPGRDEDLVTIFEGEERTPGEMIPPKTRKPRYSEPKTLHQRSVANRTR